VIRTYLGCRIFIPINALLAEAKEPSLQLRFQFLAVKFCIKILSVTDHSIAEFLFRLVDTSNNAGLFSYLTTHFLAPLCFREVANSCTRINQSYILPAYRHTFSSTHHTPTFVQTSLSSLLALKKKPLDLRAAHVFDEQLTQITEGSTIFYNDSKIDNYHYVGSAVYSA